MLSPIRLKKELDMNRRLTGIIDVLKKISAAQFYSLERRRLRYEDFTSRMKGFFGFLNVSDVDHPFLKPKQKKKGVIVITSDEGFLGELNSLVCKRALDSVPPGEDASLFVIGERGANYMEEMKETFVFFPGITSDINLSEPEALRDFILKKVLDERVGEVELFYPKFISWTQQEIHSIKLLPVDFFSGRMDISLKGNALAPLIIEPSAKRILEYLVGIWLTHNLYEIFWDSKLSELSARTLHLEGSHNELRNMNQRLEYKYFRTVHEATDRSIREVLTSMRVLEGGG